MGVYTEKIAHNEQKIEQLTKNIKRDTEKRKKLIEENARLSYLTICADYNCSGRELLDILAREHEQAKASGMSDTDNFENSSDNDTANADSFNGRISREGQMSFYKN